MAIHIREWQTMEMKFKNVVQGYITFRPLDIMMFAHFCIDLERNMMRCRRNGSQLSTIQYRSQKNGVGEGRFFRFEYICSNLKDPSIEVYIFENRYTLFLGQIPRHWNISHEKVPTSRSSMKKKCICIKYIYKEKCFWYISLFESVSSLMGELGEFSLGRLDGGPNHENCSRKKVEQAIAKKGCDIDLGNRRWKYCYVH